MESVEAEEGDAGECLLGACCCAGGRCRVGVLCVVGLVQFSESTNVQRKHTPLTHNGLLAVLPCVVLCVCVCVQRPPTTMACWA